MIKSFFRAAFNKGKQKAKSKYGHMKSAYTKYEAAELKKAKLFNKKYAIESKGYRKLNVYKSGSTQLKWAISRAKRDGFDVIGLGNEYTVLFIKKAKILKTKKVKKTVARKT